MINAGLAAFLVMWVNQVRLPIILYPFGMIGAYGLLLDSMEIEWGRWLFTVGMECHILGCLFFHRWNRQFIFRLCCFLLILYLENIAILIVIVYCISFKNRVIGWWGEREMDGSDRDQRFAGGIEEENCVGTNGME